MHKINGVLSRRSWKRSKKKCKSFGMSNLIREEQRLDWLANIVPITKKNKQIRVCIDFRDLNKACPKVDFPQLIPEIMINNTFGYERMSFMYRFSGCNQIKMSLEDEKYTSFRTPFRVYRYTVIPFGLKNAEATCQRAMMKIF